MIIVLRPNSTKEQIDHVLERIQELGLKPHLSRGEHRTIIGVIGDENKLQAEPLQAIPGVEQVLPILKPFKLASREFHRDDSVVQVGKVRIGGGAFKPRTSPYSFQGMGEEGLKILQEVGVKYDMPVVTEIMDPRQVPLVE